MSEPSPTELADRLEKLGNQLEARLDREYGQLRTSMDRGFDRVSTQITQLEVVRPEHFASDQRRQDEAIASNENAIRDTQKAIDGLRKIVVASFLGVIATGLFLSVVSTFS